MTGSARAWRAAVASAAVLSLIVSLLPGSARGAGGERAPLGLVRVLGGPGLGAASSIGFVSSGPLMYHGGSVMRTNTTYAIYWLPAGRSYDANYETLINQYLGDVAAASGSKTNVYATDTQYSDSTGPIAYGATFGGSWVDTSTPIPDHCSSEYAPSAPTLSVSGCVTQADIEAEVSRALVANGWSATATHMFMVFTPKDVGSCVDGSSGECAYTAYCAYHSSVGNALYSNQPYPDTPGTPGLGFCDSGEHPNNDWADAAINLISHEHNETITDPFGDAWYDSSGLGGENGDKCNFDFGASLGSTSFGQFNQVIDGHDYYLQQEWSNDSGACALGYTGAPRITSVTASAAPVGTSVTLAGAHFTGATAVAFNGVAASYTVDSDTVIETTVPAAATDGPVTVTTPNGTGQSPSSFTVIPSVTGFAPTGGIAGTSVVISGGGFGAVSAVRFNGTAASFTVDSPNTITATVPAGATTGPITVVAPVDSPGGAASAGSFSVTQLWLANAGHTVSAGEGGNPVAIEPTLAVNDSASPTLASASVALSAGSSAGDLLAATTTGTAIAQSFSSGTLTLTGADSPAHYEAVLRSVTFVSSSATAGDRTVTWTATDGTRSAAPVTSTVHYLALPGAPTAVVATPGDGSALISFTAPSSTGGSPITSYTVTASPGGATRSGAGTSLTFDGLTNGVAYTFSVTATNAVGTGPASAPSSPVTPVAAGGGGGGGVAGGGGGGGSGHLDLGVTVTAAPVQVNPGDSATFYVKVTDLSADPANDLHVMVTLPAGAVVGSTYADRGPGCATGTAAGTIDCNLDYLSSDSPVGNITIVLTLPSAGTATLTATAHASQGETNTANNTASATVQVGAPPAPPTSPAPSRPVVTCVVPKLAGKTLAAARRAITDARCTVGHVGERPSVAAARGRVVAQSPRATRVLAKGAKVSLTLGSGRKR